MWSRHLLLVLLLCATGAFASPAEEFQRLDRASADACLEAAGLKESSVGNVIRFSDDSGMDARIVRGRWPQPHMNGLPAQFLCLYNRPTGNAEVQEMPAQ